MNATATTLPRRSLNATWWPCEEVSAKFGAGPIVGSRSNSAVPWPGPCAWLTDGGQASPPTR